MNTFFNGLAVYFKQLANIKDAIDTRAAARNIRQNIYFRGPNVWILAFSIVIASVGLNINSTAVIIGAMLISPLMGPILGIGLGLGINDTELLKEGFRHLLVMVTISLIASFLFFFLSPLKLANPTELLARTTPTFYDVLIAFFGGCAGMLENSRKDKGTVLSGVAIATALMPPLCTAGYGLANFSLRYFAGAMMLFIINCVFISLSTYVMAKILGFKEVEFPTEAHAKRTRFFITTVVIIVVVPSVLSAISMIRENAVAQNAANFVTENKVLEHSYIYDYKVDTKSRDGKLALYIAGDALTATDRARLMATAPHYSIDTTRIQFIQHKSQDVADGFSEDLFREVYQQANDDLVQKEEQLKVLQEELLQYRRDEIPHSQISKEIFAAYPNIKDVSISRGVAVSSDSLKQKDCIMVMTKGAKSLTRDEQKKLEDWLAARLNESDIRLIHTTVK